MRIALSMLLVAAGLACGPGGNIGPPKQRELCAALDRARLGYADAISEKNQVRKNDLIAEARRARRAEIERIVGPDGVIQSWEVIVRRVSEHEFAGIDGPQLRADIGCDSLLVTTNDLTSVRKILGAVEIGSHVHVSGQLDVEGGKDFVRELNSIEASGMIRPEFGFRLVGLRDAR